MTKVEFSVYSLKSRFQQLLKPPRNLLISQNVSPNQITIFSCVLCLAYAGLLAWSSFTLILLILLPVLMLVRMALNALDGMVASETSTLTPLGGVLNEVCDIISDAALFSCFLIILPAYNITWWLLTLLALLIECVGLAVYQVNGLRPHSGPFGKSDRAVYLGVLGIVLFIFPALLTGASNWVLVYIIFGLVLAVITIWNRTSSLFE